MQEPNENGANQQEIQELLDRLRESIDIFERPPEKQPPKVENAFDDLEAMVRQAAERAEASAAQSVAPEEEAPLAEDAPQKVFAEEESPAEEVVEEEIVEEIIEERPVEEVIEEEIVDEVIEERPVEEVVKEEIIEEVIEESPARQEIEAEDASEEAPAESAGKTVPLMTEETPSLADVIDDEDVLASLMNLVDKRTPHRYRAVIRRPSAVGENLSEDTAMPATEAPAAEEETAEEAPVPAFQTAILDGVSGDTAPDEAPVDEAPTMVFGKQPSFGTTDVTDSFRKVASAPVAEQTLSGAARASVDYSTYRIADASPSARDRGEIEEFVSKDQTDRIARRYKKQKRSVGLRLAGAVVLLLLMSVSELLLLFDLSLAEMLGIDGYPFLLPMATLVLLAVTVSLATPEIREGIAAFAERHIVPESLYIISLIFIFLYSAAACFFYGEIESAVGRVPLIGSLGALLTVGVTMAEYIRLRGEQAAFGAISAPGDKLAAELSRTTARAEEQHVLKDKITPEASYAIHVKKVEFVDGYFRQMNRRLEDFRLNKILLIAINAAALMLGTVGAFLLFEGSWLAALLLAALISSAAAPFSFYLSRRYPCERAEMLAADEHCAFIGESAVYAYSKADVMVFEDVEAFTSVNTRICRIKLLDGIQVHQVLYYLTKAFGVIGGPLYGLFSGAMESVDDYSDTELLSAEKTGLHVRTGEHHVHIGRASYLSQNGIAPYYDEEDEKYIAEGKISLMYVAVDGRFMAKFYVRYEPNAKFCRNAKRLAYRQMKMLIRTFDPNLDDRLLRNNKMLCKLSVNMLHKRPEQLHDYAEERIYSGLVTAGSTKDILKLLLLCDNVKHVNRLGRMLKMIAAAVAPLPVFLVAALSFPLWLPVPLFALYWLLWFLPLALVTKRKL